MGSRVKRKKASRTRPTASGDSRTRNDRLIASVVCILLAGIVWIAFGQTLHHDFVNYDDGPYVYSNPAIINGLTPGQCSMGLHPCSRGQLAPAHHNLAYAGLPALPT